MDGADYIVKAARLNNLFRKFGVVRYLPELNARIYVKSALVFFLSLCYLLFAGVKIQRRESALHLRVHLNVIGENYRVKTFPVSRLAHFFGAVAVLRAVERKIRVRVRINFFYRIIFHTIYH